MRPEVATHAALHLLSLLEKATQTGAWSFEVADENMTMSPQLEALLELPDDAPRPQSPIDFYASASVQVMTQVLDRCRNDGEAFDREVQIETAAGRQIWVRSVGDAMRDAGGNIVRLQGVLLDITEKKRIEHETLGVTMRLSTTLASITEAFATLDHEGTFTYVSPESERLLGCTSRDLLGKTFWHELGDGQGGRFRRDITEALATGLNVEFEECYAAKHKWLEVRAYTFKEGLALYMRDITERRQGQEQLLLLQTSISRLNDIVLITEAAPIDAPGPRIVFVNDAFERHTGYTREEVLGKSPRLLQGPRTQREELARIRTALEQAEPVLAELINYKKNGEPFWMSLEIVPVDYFNRGLTHWVAIARDVTARKIAEDEIEHLAFYDPLTRLPNRQLLMDRLQYALTQSEGNAEIGALMFIDLDNFKVLNDTKGHATGDLLLQNVALRLSACLRLSDTVARLGGDEFVVLLENLGENHQSAMAQAQIVAEKILATVAEPYNLAGHQHYSTCSIGITAFTKRHQSIGDLLKQADLAMYQAKAAGRNAVCFFDPAMQAAATASASLSSELRLGLRNQEFLLHYQPQVGRDGEMIGAEALIRWQHPERGLVFPDFFISQAEESGLIMPMGNWVLETACLQLARWAEHPRREALSISVNVSARQFRHPQFVEQVMNTIQKTGIHAHRLKLELTESLLASDMDVTIAKMSMLKDAGVTLSIDDFGMGYSALSYLKYLPIDQLKIDRTFIKDVLTDPNDAAIARTIVGLAQSLGLNVIAEGVETEAQREFLARHGCPNYQGYLFSKPLPIDQLEAFMDGLPL
ncbi:MAG TPA: EAL domain-containing protein [Polaromonas sp.]|uniref:sensor domain-containing protein n=1 Tax=Polaromonas sp. TaxID=1869339 RepID=UPI002D26CD98|nr:EAL domain-containing protein [Polaromonas sp.]HYW57124.1 EAL domain-containing protein [Polaromonas sp.]